MPQFPADEHDSEYGCTVWVPRGSRARVPGISTAVLQLPFTRPRTNASTPARTLVEPPTAVQLPAEVHETEVTVASTSLFNAAIPGTSWAVPHVPVAAATD